MIGLMMTNKENTLKKVAVKTIEFLITVPPGISSRNTFYFSNDRNPID